MANQRDVAKRANVSSATVSRYLTNAQSVSEKVAKAISIAIEELNYRVDHSAQALKTGKSRHIGIIAPGVGPFHWDIFTAAQNELNSAGYYSTLFFTRGMSTKAIQNKEMILPFIRGRQIDGALHLPMCTPEDDKTLEQLMDWGRPFVVLDRQIPHTKVPQIFVDNYKAGRQAAHEFLSRGHRDFLFIWGTQDFSSALDRYFGFRDELRQVEIELTMDRQLEGEFFSLSTYQETARRWSHLPPFTAVFASNDSSAVGFIKAAKERGKECPRDFSIIGFDNNIEFSLLLSPSLATFSQPAQDLGSLGAKMLLNLLDHKPVEQLRVALETQFIRRESLALKN